MNQRIHQLAQEADRFAWLKVPGRDNAGFSTNLQKWKKTRDEKFADLIIQEYCRAVL